MSQPLYFVSGIDRTEFGIDPLIGGKLKRQAFVTYGLDVVFADVTEATIYGAQLNSGGPDGKGGVVLSYQTAAGKLPRVTAYDPSQQQWTKIGERVWIGIDTESPPKPEDLIRRRTHSGYSIDLGDHAWEVPVIRRMDDSTNLPTDMYFDDGKLIEPIKAAYRKYWEASAEVARWFFQGAWQDTFKKRAFELAIEALSINYRFSIAEQNVMRAIDSSTWMVVLMASVDVPAAKEIEEAQKKTESQPPEQSITPGFEDAYLDTAPLVANSTH